MENLVDIAALRQIDPNLARREAAARKALDEATRLLESGQRGNPSDLREAVRQAQLALSGVQETRRLAAAAVTRVTTELVAATRPYFTGDYAAATAALARLKYPPSRFATQLGLFKAAASYALYALDNERDQTLRREAEANVRECRRIAPGLKPDPETFSPRFIQFFVATK